MATTARTETTEASSPTVDATTEGFMDLSVPLALGTLQWGTTWIDHYVINAKGGVLQDATCRDILDVLTGQCGITLIDTAEGYGGGTSEKRLGRLLNRRPTRDDPANNNKNKIIFMTKFLPAPWRCVQSDFIRAARESCRRLQVDCIDIYLLHSPIHWRPIEYWIEAAGACKEARLIRSVGLSNCNADQVRRAFEAGRRYDVPVVCNQVHFSLLDYNSTSLQEMCNVCRVLGVKIVAFSPIGQGLLTDRLTPESYQVNKPAKMLRLQWEDLQPLRRVVQHMAGKYEKSMAQIALNWCIQHDVIPLVGCRSVEQASDSAGCLGWALAKDDVEALDQVALDRSTLDSPAWRRGIFVTLFGIVMVVCRTLDRLGLGNLVRDLGKGDGNGHHKPRMD